MLFRHLIFASLIASAPIVAPPIPSNMIAATITRSNVSEEVAAKVELASRKHRRLFAWNVVWLAFAGLFTIWFSWRVWKAGNEEQSAVADAASERISIVEGEASNAKASQLRIEKDLIESKTKLAEADRALLEIQERFVFRTLTGQARDKFLKELEGAPRGKIRVSSIANNAEAFAFASQISDTLRTAGYDLGKKLNSFIGGDLLVGVSIGVGDEKEQPPFARSLQRAFEAIGIKAVGRVGNLPPSVTPDTVVIHIGAKPTPP
jgi:hypothetical protein